jgi:hypothetical protein
MPIQPSVVQSYKHLILVWDVVALETPTNTCHYCLSVVCAVEIRRP